MTPADLAKAAWIMAEFNPPTPPDMIILEPRFKLGNIYATAGVTAWAERNEIDLTRLLRQHHCGQWGDLDADDKAANESALADGTRIFSSYKTSNRKIYVITEADRSMTTVLFATEY